MREPKGCSHKPAGKYISNNRKVVYLGYTVFFQGVVIVLKKNSLLYKVVTINEASVLWNRAASTLRWAIRNGRFEEWEVRKSGKDWLILYDAMVRVYGEPIKPITDNADSSQMELEQEDA